MRMKTKALLERLREDREVRETLTWPLDFELSLSEFDYGWYVVKPPAEAETIARDGTGGVFLLYGSNEYLIHITSEGQAGVIARGLAEGLALMVAYPYWRDLLKFSGGGQLKEMRRVVRFLEHEMHEDNPEIDEQRSLLRKKLLLAETVDPIELLHKAVAEFGQGIIVTARDGTEFGSLFNTFTVDSNPTWREGITND
jgi:hypothetical protein